MSGCLPTRRLFWIPSLFCAQLLLAFHCTAQNGGVSYSRGFAGSRAGENQAPTYPVDGVVVNSLTHQPIARVLVTGMSDEVLTDDEGRFELQLPRGAVMIRLQRPGYGGGRAYSEPTHVVSVTPGMSPLTFDLTPSASITAHVVLSTGDQPDGLSFSLYRKTVIDGHAQWMPSGSAVTDSGGTVRFFSPGAPGAYVLCSNTSSDGNSGADSRVPVNGYPSLCFPGATDFASATTSPLTLAPGQQAELEADLARQPFYPVSISAGSTGGARVPFLQVYSQAGQSATVGVARGTAFTFRLPNGTYYADVGFNRGKGADSFRYGRVDFTVAGGPVSGLKLVALPVQPIPVEIRRDFTETADRGAPYLGGPASGRAGGSGSPSPPLNLSLSPDGDLDSGGYGGGLRNDPDAPNGDMFQLVVTRPGRFWVHVDAYGPYYVSSIFCGGVDLANHPLVVGPGGSSYPIEITLRNDMGRLTTTLALPSSGSPAGTDTGEAARVFIYNIPLFPTTERLRNWVAQNSSGFSNELPPGEYLVVASYHPQEFDLDDPKTIARLTDQGQKVTIQPGQTATVVVNKFISDAAEAGQ